MKILITGCAGFIGFSVAKALLKDGFQIIGVDNINSYYDIKLKRGRLKELKKFRHFIFKKIDISKAIDIKKLFKKYRFGTVINLAAQAGVRYSLKYPDTYIRSNILGFFNILQESKNFKVKHLIYASSSSVYGKNTKYPFSEKHFTDEPIQIYAATKKSNELMAESYSNLYKLKCTGLRFFTVYGPWGRPDMAIFKFVENIKKNKIINVHNRGNHYRDFTYIDDIVNGIRSTIKTGIKRHDLHKIYNLGNNKAIKIDKVIKIIEKILNIKAKIKLLKFQKGEVFKTWANINKAKKELNYKTTVSIERGIQNFIEWYNNFYR